MSVESLISLQSYYAEMIFNGQKTIEVRRRRPGLDAGSRIWIYEKKPVAQIVGSFELRDVHSEEPKVFWFKYGHLTGIAEDDYYRYVTGTTCVHGLVVANPKRIDQTISLNEIRSHNERFHPPQFFSKLTPGVAPLTLLQTSTP